MVDVYCPKCGRTTDRLYETPYGSEVTGWMCEDCIFELCDSAALWAWTDEDFKNSGIVRLEAEELSEPERKTQEYDDARSEEQ